MEDPRVFERAGHLIDAGRPRDAVPILQLAITTDPDDARGWGLMAMAMASMQAPNGSEYARRAVALAPDDPRWHAALGQALIAQEAPWLAIEPLQRAVELDPEDAMYRNNLGLAFLQQGKVGQAIEHFEAALRLAPELQAAVHNLALARSERKESSASLRAIDDALRLRPDDAQTHAAKGLILMRQGRLEEAETSLRSAVQYDPSYMHAKIALASITRRRNLLWGPWCRIALWVARLRAWQRVAVLIVYVVAMRVLIAMARSDFVSVEVGIALVATYVAFLLYILLAGPMLKLAIRKGWLDVR